MKVEITESFYCGMKDKRFFIGDIVDYEDDLANLRVNKQKVAKFKDGYETKEEKFTPKKKGRPFKS